MEKFLNILNKVKDKASPKNVKEATPKETNVQEKIPKPLQQIDREKPTSQTGSKLQEDWKNLMKELTTTDIRFYFLKDEYLTKINQLYSQNSKDLDEIGISQRKFMDFIRESFERIKQAQKKLPLEPMNPKFYEYVEKCTNDLMVGLKQKFKK